MSEHKIRVGITCGDPNGIGPEVVIRSLSDGQAWELFTPVVYGPSKAVTHYKNTIEDAAAGVPVAAFQPVMVASAREAKAKRVNMVECNGLGDGGGNGNGAGGGELRIEPGTATPAGGRAAVAALQAAVADLKAGHLDVIVTAPINKENVQSDDFRFTGHTEFFAHEFGGTPLMMMCSEVLRVGLVTIHIPVARVAQAITKEKIVERLTALRHSLVADFGVVEPRIAVLSLNPHAGDGGLLGTEEKEIIAPAIEQARAQGILAFGPMAADGLFASGAFHRYDAILAMYHDQGLAPFKALTPEGVNFTAGLEVIRTSPDHGVAYDIAGQGKADPASMRQAIWMAIDIFNTRHNYNQMSHNPLRRYERERAGKDLSVKDLIPETE